MIVLKLRDHSGIHRGLVFVDDRKQVTVEKALEEGFFVEREDTPAVATLLQNFIEQRDAFSK